MKTMKSPVTMLLAGVAMLATFAATPVALAADAELDAGAARTLNAFYNHEKDGRAAVKNSAGVLVFPSIVKGAFIVGAETGDGAMQVGGKSIAYYNFSAASFGLQIGGQSKSLIVLFRDKQALDSFQSKSGWEMGVDGQVAFFQAGTGDTISTAAEKHAILFYVFGNEGLLADVSIKGGKFTKLDR